MADAEVRAGFLKFGGTPAFVFTLVIIVLIFYAAGNLDSTLRRSGTSLSQLIQSDSTRFIILGAVVLFVLITMIRAKIDDVPTLLTVTTLTAVVTFVVLYVDKIKEVVKAFDLGDLNPFDDGVSKKLENEIKQKIYQEYADPTKDEVYFVGAQTLNAIADNAGVDRGGFGLFGFSITHEDYIGIVYTDRIIRIDTEMPTPREQWNRMINGRMFPLVVYVEGKQYVVWASFEWKKIDITLFPYVGKYNLDRDYRHMPKTDAREIFSSV